MASSCHAPGHVTNSEKKMVSLVPMVSLLPTPGKEVVPSIVFLLLLFSLTEYFNFNPRYALHIFCFISKRSDFESI